MLGGAWVFGWMVLWMVLGWWLDGAQGKIRKPSPIAPIRRGIRINASARLEFSWAQEWARLGRAGRKTGRLADIADKGREKRLNARPRLEFRLSVRLSVDRPLPFLCPLDKPRRGRDSAFV